MVDRAARDEMAELIERYCRDELLSNELDEGLARIKGKTADVTVQELAGAVWGLYDDLVDHRVVATKAEWDFLQRVRLLLATNAELVDDSGGRWSWLQAPAAIALVVLVCHLLNGGTYWPAAAAGGSVSLALHFVADRWQGQAGDEAMTPFSSYRELRAVRRQAPGFVKARYRGDLQRRRIRHPLVSAVMWLPGLYVWAALSPLILLVQALPWTRRRCSVALPSA